MNASQGEIETSYLLSGWKRISNYLGKSVRTVQRYGRDLGLPTRRPAGRPRSSVAATKADIDAWVAASPMRESFQPTAAAARSPASPIAAIESRVAEIRRLGNEMLALRSEMTESVLLLRNNIRGLHGNNTPANAGKRHVN